MGAPATLLCSDRPNPMPPTRKIGSINEPRYARARRNRLMMRRRSAPSIGTCFVSRSMMIESFLFVSVIVINWSQSLVLDWTHAPRSRSVAAMLVFARRMRAVPGCLDLGGASVLMTGMRVMAVRVFITAIKHSRGHRQNHQRIAKRLQGVQWDQLTQHQRRQRRRRNQHRDGHLVAGAPAAFVVEAHQGDHRERH